VREQDERDLRTALREEAERHQPDRGVIQERVAKGRAQHARKPMERAFALMRPAAAALAVAVVLVLGIAGVRFADGGSGVDDTPAAPVVPAASPRISSAPAPAPRASASSATTRRPTSPAAPTSPTNPAKQGFLSSSGSLGANSGTGWTEDRLTLHATKKITALEVTVTAALTAGVTETGKYTTAPANLFSMTVTRHAETLVYRFTLLDGASLPTGSYIFAGQFTHAGKRSAAADTYAVKAAGGDRDVRLSGGFATR
jgi:hypothetical protein